MKKYLLPAEGTFYKMSAHTHSTRSDGHGYLRVSVMDGSDHIAYTRAYRCSEFE